LEVRAVATIGAPSDPSHVANLFKERIEVIRERGEGEVELGGRIFRIRSEFLDDIAEQHLLSQVAAMRKPLLVMHAPADRIVSIDNASALFLAARHPKSFVSLDDADHLLARRRDARYAAEVIATWSQRYLGTPAESPEQPPGEVVVAETGRGTFQQSIIVGGHHLVADEPVSVGGLDSGPSPYDLLLGALGACTAMTMRLYAERKALPLKRVSVLLRHSKIHATDCRTCESTQGQIDRIERVITLDGDLDNAQRNRLMEIADKCPVHRTLTSEVDIRTVAGGGAVSDPAAPRG
jgi:putative redox protein